MYCQMQIQNNECLRIKIELASISTELGSASFKYASFWNHTFCRLIYRTIGVFVTFRVDFIIIDFLILKLCLLFGFIRFCIKTNVSISLSYFESTIR